MRYLLILLIILQISTHFSSAFLQNKGLISKQYRFQRKSEVSKKTLKSIQLGSLSWKYQPSFKNKFSKTLYAVQTPLEEDPSPQLQENPLKTVYSVMLFCFVSYAFTLAPDSSPKDFELIQKLIATPFDGSSNALFVFLFNALGIIPATLAALLLPGAKNQKIPAFPFVFSSFFLGFFAIGPYLALRKWNTNVIDSEKGFGSALFEFKGTALILLGYGVYLTYYLISQFQLLGVDHVLSEYWQLFMSQQLVHVSSLDFTVLSLSVSFNHRKFVHFPEINCSVDV